MFKFRAIEWENEKYGKKFRVELATQPNRADVLVYKPNDGLRIGYEIVQVCHVSDPSVDPLLIVKRSLAIRLDLLDHADNQDHQGQ